MTPPFQLRQQPSQGAYLLVSSVSPPRQRMIPSPDPTFINQTLTYQAMTLSGSFVNGS